MVKKTMTKEESQKNMPKWARKLDNFGHSIEKRPEHRKLGYLIDIAVNLILLYLANNLLKWNVPFITSEFNLVLPLFNLSVAANIIAKYLFLFYDPAVFRAFGKLLLNLIGIAFMLKVYQVFPFDFSVIPDINIEPILKFALLIGIIGTVIGTLIEFVKLIYDSISGK